MSTTACRRDARDPGMQARRPRFWNVGVPPANLKEHRRFACDSSDDDFLLQKICSLVF
ncbi:MAG: hypothetical protein LBP59_11500 [Planctomycetaceae bacterium]|nr:hypothetical protein [Planctomycetaceae bacterium]